MTSNVEKVFEGVGWKGQANGRLVVGADELAYHSGGNDDDDQKKSLFVIDWNVVSSVKSDGKILLLDAKDEDSWCEFTMSSKSNARMAEDVIGKLLARDTTSAVPQPKDTKEDVPLLPEPEHLVKVGSDDTPAAASQESESSQGNEEEDLEAVRAISKESNKNRRAKRKATANERATKAGAELVTGSDKTPAKRGLGGKNAAKRKVDEIPDPDDPPSLSTSERDAPFPGAATGSAKRLAKHGLGRNKAPKAREEASLDRVPPPSLSTSESDAPFLSATSSDQDNAFVDASTRGSESASLMEEVPGSEGSTSENGSLIEADITVNPGGYLVEATLILESEQGFQDEEGFKPDDTAVVVEAHEAGLRDHLQSRKLQFFIVGMLCCFVVITVILVVVFVVALPRSSEEPSDTTGTNPTNPTTPPVSTGPKPIADLVAESSDLTILAQLLEDDNLLTSGNDSYTLFAPNDDAFIRIGFNESNVERGVLEFSLKQHVVPGIIPSFRLFRGNAFLTEEEGVLLWLDDTTVRVLSEMEASNGMVYMIDAVLQENAHTGAMDVCEEESSRTGFHNSWGNRADIGYFESNTAYGLNDLSSVCKPNTAWALAEEFTGYKGGWFTGTTGQSYTGCMTDNSSRAEHLIKFTMPADAAQYDLFVFACQPVPESPTLATFEGPRLLNGNSQLVVPRRNVSSGEVMPFSSAQLQPISDDDLAYLSVVAYEGDRTLLEDCYTTESESSLPKLNATQTATTTEVIVKSETLGLGFEYWVAVYWAGESERARQLQSTDPTDTSIATIPFSQCLESMNATDTNQDSFLSRDEFVSFLNELTAATNNSTVEGLQTDFEESTISEFTSATNDSTYYSTFESLPPELQASFVEFATSKDQIDITGAIPSQETDAVQLAFLEQVCNDTEVALSAQSEPIAMPSTQDPSLSGEANPQPAPMTVQVLIHSSFIVTNRVGITANAMNNVENPDRQRFQVVYALFVQELVQANPFPSPGTASPLAADPGPALGGRRELVGYAEDSAQLRGFEDIECPNELDEIVSCMLVYADYVVDEVASGTQEAVYDFYVALTQASMKEGDPNLKDNNAIQGGLGATQLDVYGATEEVLIWTIAPTMAATTTPVPITPCTSVSVSTWTIQIFGHPNEET